MHPKISSIRNMKSGINKTIALGFLRLQALELTKLESVE